jgi:hypothetical protein
MPHKTAHQHSTKTEPFDTVGVAPFIDGVSFGALIADKAFDSNAIIADRRNVQMAASDRELLRQTQRVQTHRHARRQAIIHLAAAVIVSR